MALESHNWPPKEENGTEQSKFVVEGRAELGPDQFPLFVEGEAVGPQVVEHFNPPIVRGYYRLGRVRVTIELLNEE